MAERKVHCIDAAMVGLEIDQAMGLPHARLAHRAQFDFHRIDEGGKDIEHQRAAGLEQLGHGRIDDRVDHDRSCIVTQAGLADAFGRFAGFFNRIDEGDPIGDEGEPGELGQQAMPNGFNGDTGSIGNVEDRPDTGHCVDPVC